MTIEVECYAGYRGAEEPRAFVIGERRLDVLAIEDRWAGLDYRYFKVAASDGNTYVLRHDEAPDVWTLGAFRRALPEQDFVYLGDNLNAPYGWKSPTEIYGLTIAGVGIGLGA